MTYEHLEMELHSRQQYQRWRKPLKMNSVLMVVIGVPVWFLQMIMYSIYTTAVDIFKSQTDSRDLDDEGKYSVLQRWAEPWAMNQRKLNQMEALVFVAFLLSGLVISINASTLEEFDLLAYMFLIPWGVVYIQEIIIAIWIAASRRL
ncbi:MAG: hypothetical protein EAX81_03670 [Candidatus Thorarchaeota archaeon]|nr:hypothetical protein [Candidatus Thorarchaeota archaeon]